MNILEHARQLDADLTGQLAAQMPDAAGEKTVDQVIEAIKSTAQDGHFHSFGADVTGAQKTLTAKYSAPVAEQFMSLVLLRLIVQWYSAHKQSAISPRIEALYDRETQRLIEQIQTPPEGLFSLERDEYRKDLGCYTGRLIPCGAQVSDVYSGVPRSVLKTDGLGKLARNLAFFSSHGFKPYVEIHTHQPTLFEFNADGWDECYLNVADVLRHQPDLRGMVGTSWFYDPALETVSPRLGYLRHRPTENGARLFHVGVTDAAMNDALATSPTRRKLHAEGKYMPTYYALIWPRDALIRWADSQQA